MSGPISIDAIKCKLVERLDTLVAQLYPAAVQDGKEWCIGDVHGAPGQSLRIHRGDGHKRGWWRDFGGDARGDVLTLVALRMCDGDIGRAVGWSVRWLGLGGMSPSETKRLEEKARADRKRHAEEAAAKAADLIRAAKGHYLGRVPLLGSPAERYLVGCRGLPIRQLTDQNPRAFSALGYRPAMVCPETGKATGRRRPAMIAAVSHLERGFLTIHRTFLEPDGAGGMRKAADMAKPKRAYSEYSGGLIPIWRGDSGKPLRHAPEGEWIAGAEGIEDAIAIAIAMPELRTFAALSLSNLGALVLPPQIGGLWWHRHRGDDPEAVRQFERAAEQLARRGIALKEVWAPGAFKDFTAYAEAEYAAEAAAARARFQSDVA